MRAAIWEAPGQPLRIDEVPDPRPGPADLLLRVRACGICGSDLHISEIAVLSPGSVMGHEFAGEVVEAGAEVQGDWKPRDRVCSLPLVACGGCRACLTGDLLHCGSVRSIGLGDLPGAYAEYVVAGSRETFRVPEGLSHHEGALVEPLAVGLHAVNEGRLRAGENVLVVGAGPVGIAVATWARRLGAREVIVSDRIPGRIEKAARLGATGGIDAGAEEVLPAFERLAGGPPDLIFECVGRPGMLQECVDMAPALGRVIAAGVGIQPDPIVPAVANLKELWIKFVTGYRRQEFGFTLDMLGARRLEAGEMITDVVDLPGLPDAFESLKHPETQCKVIVEP